MGNIIAPYEYCHSQEIGERLFRDAHHYFNLLSKNFEANSEIAKRLGDSLFIPDEEMFSVAQFLCEKSFNVSRPALLKPQERLAVAKQMKMDYNASNKQLQRILKLDKLTVNELFPSREDYNE